MKIATVVLAALTATTAFGAWVYEGKWGSFGSGDGQFSWPQGIEIAPNGNVYVAEYRNKRVQYFTANGSFLGKWQPPWTNGDAHGVAVGPQNRVYVTTGTVPEEAFVGAFTRLGSFVRSWSVGVGEFVSAEGVAVAANASVYVALGHQGIANYNPSGSLLRSWQAGYAFCVAIAPNGNVYATEAVGDDECVRYYTPTGSRLGSWGSYGSGPGQFDQPYGVDVGPDGTVYVADQYNNRVQYFTATGSLLGIIGELGSGNGELHYPVDVAVGPNGKRLYVVEAANDRVQYFRWSEPAVEPASLGRVKALFR
jgi:DNA-binding beta-propeller fold protein YncE